jgi:hypothetical protein
MLSRYAGVAIVTTFLFTQTIEAQVSGIQIIPEPQQVEVLNGEVALSSAEVAFSQDEGALQDQIVRLLAEEVAGSDWRIAPDANIRFERLPEPPELPEERARVAFEREGYLLEARDGRVRVAAMSPRGLYYGATTLAQLLEVQGKQFKMPAVHIVDWPGFELRGITDDVSRGQVSTLDHFKKIIRFLSRYKMNVYMPYLEDMFTFKKYPQIGRGRGALTPGEVRELQNFADNHQVEIIPIFQTLGHYENILNQPEFMHLAEYPGAASLNVSSEETYRFLNDLFDEIAPAFRSQFFHIGADESWDVGKGASKPLVEKWDLATAHAKHYQRVFDIARRHGKQVMMYADIILREPTILGQIPKDIIMFDWHYGVADRYSSVEVFRNAGRKFIVSPALWNWARIFPDYHTALANMRNYILDGYEAEAMGAVVSNWNDFGGETFREYNWYGYAYAAECAWSPANADVQRFSQKFFADFYGSAGPEAEVIYTLLADAGRRVSLHDFRRHPFLPEQKSAPQLWDDILSLTTRMPLVRQELDRLATAATRNRDHLDFLRFAAEQAEWTGRKLAAVKEIRRLEEGGGKQEEIISLCEEMITGLKQLRERFAALWHRVSKPEGLDLLLALYDRQIAVWEDKIEQVKKGESTSPLLPSAWIYHPNLPIDSDKNIGHAFFRKTFYLDAVPRQAFLQAMGDSHVEVYVNGTKVGTVLATASLSLRVENQRIKFWDIRRLLRRGKNVIAVEARAYGENPAAGANIYVELYHGSEVTTILSNTYWKTSQEFHPNWTSIDFDDHQWLNAEERARSERYSRPLFERGLGSRLER